MTLTDIYHSAMDLYSLGWDRIDVTYFSRTEKGESIYNIEVILAEEKQAIYGV